MIDVKCVFCENTLATSAITSSAIDFLQSRPTTGLNDRPLYVALAFPVALVGTSIAVTLEDSDDNSSFAAVAATGAISPSATKDGVYIPMPFKHRRYLRIKVAPTSITAGKVTAYLTDVVHFPTTYKEEGIEFLPGATV